MAKSKVQKALDEAAAGLAKAGITTTHVVVRSLGKTMRIPLPTEVLKALGPNEITLDLSALA